MGDEVRLRNGGRFERETVDAEGSARESKNAYSFNRNAVPLQKENVIILRKMILEVLYVTQGDPAALSASIPLQGRSLPHATMAGLSCAVCGQKTLEQSSGTFKVE
ncbi:hypothetical protein lerEdw1_016422 [Lerista edwardsae]|nr:hypothetical protein lerEdw1_016422 [Lerista edwardsae]